jgi:hypothetical protein
LTANKAVVFKGFDHIVNSGWRGVEELLHVVFCWRLAMDSRIGIDERQVLSLQRSP